MESQENLVRSAKESFRPPERTFLTDEEKVPLERGWASDGFLQFRLLVTEKQGGLEPAKK